MWKEEEPSALRPTRYMLHKPRLLFSVVVVWVLLDLYVLPLPRWLLIPLSALMTTLILLWVAPRTGEQQRTTPGYQMHRVIQENYDLSQTILRLSEEHQLLCEIRNSMAAVRKNCNESLYLLRQGQKDVKKRPLLTSHEPLTPPFHVPTLTTKSQEEEEQSPNTFNRERAHRALGSASMTDKALSNSKPRSFHSLPLIHI